MGCKGRARPLHARASGTSVRITCDFHEHGTCALHTARPDTRTCSVFPQRIYLTGTSHRNRRENKDDAKPLHNRERQPLRENKNKNPRIFATFLRLGIPFPFPQSENRQFYGQLSAFSRPDSRFGTTQQSAIAKKLQFEPFFCFRAPGAASGRRHGRGDYFGRHHGRQSSRSVTRQPGCSIVREEDGACSAPSGGSSAAMSITIQTRCHGAIMLVGIQEDAAKERPRQH